MSLGTEIRNQVWVRFADPEKEPVKAWCQANQARNAFDDKVLQYPSTKVLAAENGKTLAYMPVQTIAMLESIGVNPEADPLEVARSVMEMTKATATLAHGAGFREVWFAASDESTANGAKLMGFEEVPFRLFRRRL